MTPGSHEQPALTSMLCGTPKPWHDLPEFRALDEVRRAFVKGGIPLAPARSTEACARLSTFWALYGLGHVLEEIQRRTRLGSLCWASVRVSELGPGRVLLDIAIEPHAGELVADRGGP
ncbi:Hypothetical protein A7982_07866 [Minicystis rosea]|nr:Hypothetical protein A7982_07866 [Minicystis rosea]